MATSASKQHWLESLLFSIGPACTMISKSSLRNAQCVSITSMILMVHTDSYNPSPPLLKHGKTYLWISLLTSLFRPTRVVVDRLTKFAHFIALASVFSAASLANVFLSEIYHLHGAPKTIVSDRGRIFISKFGRNFFKQWAQH